MTDVRTDPTDPIPQPQVVADQYVRVARSPNDWQSGPFIGSPTLARLPSGRLLFCHDLFGGGCNHDTSYFLASTDDGKTWHACGALSGLFWPSLLCCASGLYVVGVKPGRGRARNDLCIARRDDEGQTWSAPAAVTRGWAVHRGNTGALVSRGRVMVSFEVAPQCCTPSPRTVTTDALRVGETDVDTVTLPVAVADPECLIPHSLVAIEHGSHRLHARVLAADSMASILYVRPERWAAVDGFPDAPANTAGPWAFPSGSMIGIASGTLGNNRDFWVVAADADETADLCDPATWRFSNPVANPAYTHARALAELFGLNFAPRDDEGRAPAVHRSAWSGWLEGSLVRMEHPGGDDSVRNLMRIAAGSTGNIAAILRIDDPPDGPLTASFDRLAPVPGLGCTHGCVRYDTPSRLYWLASNINRDSTRNLAGIPLSGGDATQERSNLALFYSLNCADWFMAGLVASSRDWIHSFHYPYFIIDGNDLLFAVRSHVESPLTEKTIHANGQTTADNHNSNAATFHRVRAFRRLANEDFIRYHTPA